MKNRHRNGIRTQVLINQLITTSFHENISISQLKTILQKYSDDDIVNVTIDKKAKPNDTSHFIPSIQPIIIKPLTPPQYPTSQFKPADHKLYRHPKWISMTRFQGIKIQVHKIKANNQE